MDVNKMLVELRQEREQSRRQLSSWSGSPAGEGKRRGRPPLWMTTTAAPAKRARPAAREQE